MKYILCMVYMFFSTAGLTFIKIGTKSVSGSIIIPILGVNINRITLLGIACYGVSFLLYLGVIARFELGVIVPIIGGIINIAILFVSIYILREDVSTRGIIGAVIIVIGIVIMNIK